MENDLVSVIIPSYNYEQYIIECMKSIFDQDYKMIEIIVIEDCSKDNSREIIKNFLKKDEVKERFYNITYIENKENRGAHYSINKGIMNACGKYIAIINADDLYETNRFSSMIPFMKAENLRIAFSNIEIVDKNSIISTTEEAEYFRKIQNSIMDYPFISYALMRQNVAISTGNMLFTKDLYEELKGFRKYKYIHDWDFILRACLIEEPGFVVNTKYFYRLHDTNSFRGLKGIADMEVNIVLSEFFSYIKKGCKNSNLSKNNVYNEIKDSYLKIHWRRGTFFSNLFLRFKYIFLAK